MADWTAITGIVVSGVAGPSVVGYLAARRQHRELAHQRAMVDRGDIRALLDEAAIALHEASYSIGAIRQSFMRHGATIGERDSDALVSVRDRGRALDVIRERLAVRLGRDSEAVQAFIRADEQMLDLFRAVTLLADLGDRQELRSTHEQLEKASEAFETSREQFLAVASRPAMGGVALTP